MKKKILIICPTPYPLNSGGKQALFNIIDYCREFIDITLFIITYGKDSNINILRELWQNIEIYNFEKNPLQYPFSKIGAHIGLKFQSIFQKKYNRLNILDNSNCYYSNDILIKKLNDVIQNNKFDLIQIEFYEQMEFIYTLKHIKCPKIFVHHEIRFERNLTLLKDSFVSDIEKLNFEKSKNIEIGTLKEYDGILTLTDIDRNKLKKELPTIPIFNSPVGIREIKKQNNKHKEFKFDNKLVFIGPSSHYPNVEGIEWFVNNVFNGILTKKPNVELHVIGKWDKKNIQKIKKYNNIIFHGYVDDITSIMSNSIMIVPINIGSGMRMKIIEAVNYNIPFITTVLGVEGLLFKDNLDCFICDNAEMFTEKTIELIDDNEMQKQFIRNSREIYDNNYSIKFLSQKRIDIYEKVIKEYND